MYSSSERFFCCCCCAWSLWLLIQNFPEPCPRKGKSASAAGPPTFPPRTAEQGPAGPSEANGSEGRRRTRAGHRTWRPPFLRRTSRILFFQITSPLIFWNIRLSPTHTPLNSLKFQGPFGTTYSVMLICLFNLIVAWVFPLPLYSNIICLSQNNVFLKHSLMLFSPFILMLPNLEME